MPGDRLANAERPPHERPTRAVPLVPDHEPPEGHGYWHGSVGGLVEHWKRRALAAERALEELQARLAAWEPEE